MVNMKMTFMVVQIEYPGIPLKKVVLFKCEWFDPTIDRGTRVNKQYGIIQIRHNRRYGKYDPFILADKAIQVYFAPHPICSRSNADWWFVVKKKARGLIEDQQVDDSAYQEDFLDQNIVGISVDTDLPVILLDVDGRFDEVDDHELIVDHAMDDDDDEEEEEEEEEEEIMDGGW